MKTKLYIDENGKTRQVTETELLAHGYYLAGYQGFKGHLYFRSQTGFGPVFDAKGKTYVNTAFAGSDFKQL
jgi:hypothetical protein